MKRLYSLLFAAFILASGSLSGCGGSNRQLQFLSVSPASTTAQGGQAQFTATGQFTAAPMSESPASVIWWQSPPIIDPPGTMIGITLVNQPFTAQCFGFTGPITVIAVAPVQTHASGDSMPLSAFVDLIVKHSATQESGFVAATAQMNCP
ncbi:MAG TPA: hypothetical protein VLA83_15855 [Candidatus Binatia bacterium]|nr:hypothetical protein [Candidatus Binatia bacterium]